MPIFRKKERAKEDRLYQILDFIEGRVPKVHKLRETLLETLHTAERLTFQLEELKPYIDSMQQSVERLKENIGFLKESLRRHGFDEKKEESKEEKAQAEKT